MVQPATARLVTEATLPELARDVIGTALVAGTGVTISVNDATDKITIASTATGTGTSYTDEQVRDVMGVALVAGANVSITVNDANDTITIASTATGSGGTGLTYATDPRTFGAKFDGSTDDSAAWQSAVNSLPAGGGVILCPDGVSVAAGIQLRSGISIKGVGGNRNAFGGTGRGTVVSHPSSAPSAQIVSRVVVTAGGAGYTSAPAVAFSGGGGSGLAATAYVSGGKVTAIRVTNSGSGYTSAPTVAFSGGGGASATATAVRTSPIFYYPSDAYSDAISFSDITLTGQTGFHTVGIWLGHSWFTRITKVDTYFFPAEAIWIQQGGGPHISDCKIFGCARTVSSPLYAGPTIVNDPAGSLRFGKDCSDVVVNAVEVGAGPSNDQANLPNAAIYYEGTAGNFSGVVAEGGDVGIRITGVNSRWINARADINYGHGWLFTRDLATNQPPLNNWLMQCWGHNNSKYANNTYDNWYLSADCINNRFNGLFSDATGNPLHRYGFNNTTATGTRLYFWDDFGAGTAALNGIAPTV